MKLSDDARWTILTALHRMQRDDGDTANKMRGRWPALCRQFEKQARDARDAYELIEQAETIELR